MADPDLQMKGSTCRSLTSPAGTRAGPGDNIFWTVTVRNPVERSLVDRSVCGNQRSRRCHYPGVVGFFCFRSKGDGGRGTTDHRGRGKGDRRPWTLEAGAKSKATIGREEWGVRIPELEKRETGQSKEVGQTG
jgi:hypothetical protein